MRWLVILMDVVMVLAAALGVCMAWVIADSPGGSVPIGALMAATNIGLLWFYFAIGKRDDR